MPLAVFSSPGRYVQGRDATAELGTQLQAAGLQGPVIILADPVRRRVARAGLGLHPTASPWAQQCQLDCQPRLPWLSVDSSLLCNPHLAAGGGAHVERRVGGLAARRRLFLLRAPVWGRVYRRG